MTKKIFIPFFFSFCWMSLQGQAPLPVKQFLKADYMDGSTFSLMVKDVDSDELIYQYDAGREVIPASVLKTVTTATALEILGDDYRFPTSIEYDGEIKEGILHGDLYIKGSGDPTLGSGHFTPNRNVFNVDRYNFAVKWAEAVKKAGIQKITGSVIADESIFDTEGISPKWLFEDMGSYYGAGSYGLNVFDNFFHLELSTGKVGEKPIIRGIKPELLSVNFHNYLTSAAVPMDSAFVTGGPFSTDRYLYGIVPVNRSSYMLKGDIPDPALFIAGLFTEKLKEAGIVIENAPSCYRLEDEAGRWNHSVRKKIVTTYSPTLREIVRITNERSHNLYADALLKTIGLEYNPGENEVISSFGKGIKVIHSHWEEEGLDTSFLNIYDGSGLAITDKVTASFVVDLLVYMHSKSPHSDAFVKSFPKAGMEGSVRNFLKGTSLAGTAILKSGGMSRVRSYAGYIKKNNKTYAIAVFANNYNCESRVLIKALERLLIALFEGKGDSF